MSKKALDSSLLGVFLEPMPEPTPEQLKNARERKEWLERNGFKEQRMPMYESTVNSTKLDMAIDAFRKKQHADAHIQLMEQAGLAYESDDSIDEEELEHKQLKSERRKERKQKETAKRLAKQNKNCKKKSGKSKKQKQKKKRRT